MHTGDVGLAEASDARILEWARSESVAIVTLDADFHAILATTQATTPSVIRIRIEGLRADAITKLLLGVLARWGEAIRAGAMVSVRSSRTSVRRLPVHRGTS